ncbi:GRF zinc finger-containing protein-like protein [Striga asiatica]|uniref:GRF zinc finger-containing protein-like protein n=1 Tax=Striga asiatica TaxID=4170 RepID=A0A5A7R8U8_STRAF|nr:GRF zinc finger-containing protein-like protein [Striga asiatica]
MFRQISEELIDDFCRCGKPTVRKTSWADGNAGRRYSACEKYRFASKEIVLSTIHGQMEREAFPSTRLALLRGRTLNPEEVDPPRFPFQKESPVKHKMQQLNTDNNTSHFQL